MILVIPKHQSVPVAHKQIEIPNELPIFSFIFTCILSLFIISSIYIQNETRIQSHLIHILIYRYYYFVFFFVVVAENVERTYMNVNLPCCRPNIERMYSPLICMPIQSINQFNSYSQNANTRTNTYHEPVIKYWHHKPYLGQRICRRQRK